ncbi:Zip-domain-containing protein [Stipitochalara longipes BDJ]|nr:Zip-domain-containing protein [Stipitochalara longipes BDJ]
MAGHMDNDTRGWIMCTFSGIACTFGASFICIDILIRCIPSKRTRNFSIQDSSVFLASSLSLSFGVMAFSALYSMLPSSKKYLINGGYSPADAAWILLGCFMAGFVGIQILSRVLHHYIPSNEVECDHSHEDTQENHDSSRSASFAAHSRGRQDSHPSSAPRKANRKTSEASPLLAPPEPVSKSKSKSKLRSKSKRKQSPQFGAPFGGDGSGQSRRRDEATERRPSMIEVQKRVMSFVKDTKTNCDSSGPCYGYSDPCGQECLKHLSARPSTTSRHGTLRSSSALFAHSPSECPPSLSNGTAEAAVRPTSSNSRATNEEACESADENDLQAQHHHHVPENAFMSIGLQTSIAIALHKLPEGFITYATNHANPSLGFSVFLALSVHNVTEGFAMALPLYLALRSRMRAMFWSSLLGGISQPLGAGTAAAWFKIAGTKGHKPGEAVYGGMFAITAGIMVSVALQLFVEALSLNHNRNLCIAFAFFGMTIMGMSNALTS